MKRFISRCWGICLALSLVDTAQLAAAQNSGAPLSPEIVARVHSRGMLDLAADQNGRTFKEIWNLPASSQLREEALDKLAAGLAARFTSKGQGQGSPADCAKLIRPFLTDLLTAETYIEMVEPAPGRLESTFALRLDEARSQVWRHNWDNLLANWSLRAGPGTARIATLSTNGWFALQCLSAAAGQEQPSKSSIFERIKLGQRPVPKTEEYWLRVESDLARLSGWLFKSRQDSWPRIDWTVAGRKEYLRSQARLTFREPTAPQAEKWEIPTGIIRDPLISFTAVQGLGPWLKRQPLIQQLGLDTIPNQLFAWGLSQTAFQLQAAMPAPNAKGAFDRVVEKGLPKWNQTLSQYAVGTMLSLPDRPEVVWRGLPILVPYLEPVQSEGGSFLHTGIFPVSMPTNSPPQQLLQQLTSVNNLLYYDWEITESRLVQLRPLLQLSGVFLTVSPMSTNSSAYKWLDAIEPRLGNTITEVTTSSPRELNVVRTSHLGLNGLELLTLANWLEGTNFPNPNLDIHFRPIVKSTRQKKSR